MEELRGQRLPTLQEHALSHIIQTSSLTGPQMGILRNHVQIAHTLEDLLTESGRHSSLESNLGMVSGQYLESYNLVDNDPVLSEALRQYEHMVSEAQAENEP